LATFLALGAFLAAVAFLVVLATRSAAPAPTSAFPCAFGFAGWSAFGSGLLPGVPAFVVTGSPSPWIHAQIRLIAVFRSVN
jgi:hypothetical protein